MNKMQLNVYFLFLILHLFYVELKAQNSTSCGGSWSGDWIAFKDEKCYMILDDTLHTFDEGAEFCAALEGEPTLPFIHTKEEQDFLSNFLFKTKKKVENFWIGAKFSGGKYQWLDNSDFSFTNWQVEGPQQKTNHCIQIEADERRIGKWINQPCEKKNLVICQKMQPWSLARLQRSFLDFRKKQTDDFDNLKQNIVPIGFIYPQLPNEKSPSELWPWMKWTDISAIYAGVFFRVNGGDAAAFGQVQADNAPRLDQIYSANSGYLKSKKAKTYWGEDMPIPRTGWSNGLLVGASFGSDVYLQFQHSPGEVRPRNMAIRIWKRSS